MTSYINTLLNEQGEVKENVAKQKLFRSIINDDQTWLIDFLKVFHSSYLTSHVIKEH